MPLEITIRICDRGSITCHHVGNKTLAINHGAEAVEMLAKVCDELSLAEIHGDGVLPEQLGKAQVVIND